MFRVFLRRKLLSGLEDGTTYPAAAGHEQDSTTFRRNRRLFARYKINNKHLAIMNDADIFPVREISTKGFSIEVSVGGFKRLIVGDVYDARIRYLSEMYDLQAKVTWKSESFVGFSIFDAAAETHQFIKRLLRPIEIADSLQPVMTAFMKDSNTGKSWYHGEEESDLYVWHDAETQQLRAWQLAIGNEYVSWSEANGVITGSIGRNSSQNTLFDTDLKSGVAVPDAVRDPQKQQFALDVIMALAHPIRDEILLTLDTNTLD